MKRKLGFGAFSKFYMLYYYEKAHSFIYELPVQILIPLSNFQQTVSSVMIGDHRQNSMNC